MSGRAPTVSRAPDGNFGDHVTDAPNSLMVPFADAGEAIAVANCSRADNLTVNIFHMDSGDQVAILGLAARGPYGLVGLYAPYTAAQLREFSAEAARIADKMDGGRGKQ